jgi:hypothetical protein
LAYKLLLRCIVCLCFAHELADRARGQCEILDGPLLAGAVLIDLAEYPEWLERSPLGPVVGYPRSHALDEVMDVYALAGENDDSCVLCAADPFEDLGDGGPLPVMV